MLKHEFVLALCRTGLSAEEIAGRLRKPTPTVELWLEGKNLPFSLARPLIIRALPTILDRIVEETED